jgi:hypothetical protein
MLRLVREICFTGLSVEKYRRFNPQSQTPILELSLWKITDIFRIFKNGISYTPKLSLLWIRVIRACLYNNDRI